MCAHAYEWHRYDRGQHAEYACGKVIRVAYAACAEVEAHYVAGEKSDKPYREGEKKIVAVAEFLYQRRFGEPFDYTCGNITTAPAPDEIRYRHHNGGPEYIH